jgi:hypothetical protein
MPERLYGLQKLDLIEEYRDFFEHCGSKDRVSTHTHTQRERESAAKMFKQVINGKLNFP